MKQYQKLFLTAFAVFSVVVAGCVTGSVSRSFNVQEPISEKHALQYFIDEDIRLGWNLGNTLDAHNNGSPSETSWGNPRATQELFNGVKAQGIDIVRIPITWGSSIGSAPNHTISPSRLNRVEEVVNYARNAGLKVIINTHHDDVAGSGGWIDIKRAAENPARRTAITEKFRRVWTQIAERFEGYGEWLIFEGMNEVHDGGWGWGQMTSNARYRENIMDIINEWNQTFTDAVRATGGNNEFRFLMYPSLCSNYEYILHDGRIGGAEVGKLFKLPTDPSGEGRQIVTFHYYDPFDFAHDASVTMWDTSANRNNITNLFARFQRYYIDRGIPVIIGEMGPRWQTNARGQENRLKYIDFVWGEARRHGLVPVYWDDGGNFRMMNRQNARPRDAHAEASFAAMRTAVGRE